MMLNEIQELLQEKISAAEVIVTSDDGRHFEATIITDAFINKKTIERQKIVYGVIGSHITSGSIHALSLKTFTQQEWKDKCDN